MAVGYGHPEIRLGSLDIFEGPVYRLVLRSLIHARSETDDELTVPEYSHREVDSLPGKEHHSIAKGKGFCFVVCAPRTIVVPHAYYFALLEIQYYEPPRTMSILRPTIELDVVMGSQ